MSVERGVSGNARSDSKSLENAGRKNPPRKPVAPVLATKESESAIPREWVLVLPFGKNPIPANGPHGQWYKKAAAVKQVRSHVAYAAKNAHIPGLQRVRVELTWVVGTRHRRDVDNLVPLLKACCDALSAPHHPVHRIVEDDTPEFMVKVMPAIEYRPKAQPYFFLKIVECHS